MLDASIASRRVLSMAAAHGMPARRSCARTCANIRGLQFIVMFRSRFHEAFPRNAPHVGPQDVELGVAEGTPSPDVEGLLCALLGLVLNRKKPVECVFPLHHSRRIPRIIVAER